MLRALHDTLHTICDKLGMPSGVGAQAHRALLNGRDKMSSNACQIAIALQDAGHETYLVGGCVRDVLCGIKPKDFDIATAATPEKVKKVFGRKARIIGRRFKIVHVIEGGELIEVSTFRGQASWLEQLWGGQRQNNNIYGSLVQDVWRRDFSCNALYYDVKTDEMLDYVEGIAAINKKIIQVLGEPAKRLEEDPVRILRAIRFKAKTGFTIDATLEQAIIQQGASLTTASSERLLIEMTKLFYHGHGARSWRLLRQYKLDSVLFPGMAHIDKTNMQYYNAFISQAFHNTDKRFKSGQQLSTGFLFAVLLWPMLQEKLKQQKYTGSSHYRHCMESVLKQESKVVSIPKRLQEAVINIWQLQQDFRKKFRQAHKVAKNTRFRAGYDFLITHAQVDEREVEVALRWQPYIQHGKTSAMKKTKSTRDVRQP